MPKAEKWVRFDGEQQKSVDALIENARHELLAAGFPARGIGFPFAMHHGHYRTRIRIGRTKTTHAQVAYLLNRWTEARGRTDDYARQALCGAVGSMVAKSASLGGRIPASVMGMMEQVGGGMDFINWSTENCEALVGDIIDDPAPSRDEMIDALLDTALGRSA